MKILSNQPVCFLYDFAIRLNDLNTERKGYSLKLDSINEEKAIVKPEIELYFDEFLQRKIAELVPIKYSQKADSDKCESVLKSTNEELKILEEEFDPTFIENSNPDYEY